MDELARIAALRRRLRCSDTDEAPGMLVPNGDDAAVWEPDPRPLVASVDASVEGTHFERHFASPEALGYRAFMAATSDLAAMGADPESALLAIGAPPSLPFDVLLGLADGIAEAAAETGSRIVGGNLGRGPALDLTTTVLGRLPVGSAPISRAGAQVGDRVYVSGHPGAAALGLAAIRRGDATLLADAAPFVHAFRRPRARVDLSETLRRVAHAAIDLSDGLTPDLGHVARASRVRIRVELAAVPRHPRMAAVAEALALDLDTLLASGGEDYELAIAAPVAAHGTLLALGLSCIGEVHAGSGGPGLEVVASDGTPRGAWAPRGFSHF